MVTDNLRQSPLLNTLAPILSLVPFLDKFGSARFRRWLVQFVPSPVVQQFKHVIDVMDIESRKVYARKTGLQNTEGSDSDDGRDIVSVLGEHDHSS